MRLLVSDAAHGDLVDIARLERVTGLGEGLHGSGRLSSEAIARTVRVLAEYGEAMDQSGVERRMAVATSASRDAANREEFFDQAEGALGVRPEMISGPDEANFAYQGATSGLPPGKYTVVDIGGGSTEFVTEAKGVSIDIGSVRLTGQILNDRPSTQEQVGRAYRHVAELFTDAAIKLSGEAIGVAGTWTSLAALGIGRYDRDEVHHSRLSAIEVETQIETLAGLTVDETSQLPGLDPARAPVILAGAVIAQAATTHLGLESILISETDLLDGVVQHLVG